MTQEHPHSEPVSGAPGDDPSGPSAAAGSPGDDTPEGLDLVRLAEEGVEHCRAGRWEEGMALLRRVAEADSREVELPGLFYSYLGLGIARFDKRYREGLALCRHGVKRSFYDGEPYVAMARVQLMTSDRRSAVQTLRSGLKMDPTNPNLVALRKELGLRRRPVIPFLDRANPINVFLGRLRSGK